MAARAGITRADVVRTAVSMLDDGRPAEELRLSGIAERLGIRTQSLYAHVDGTDGLTRALAEAGLHELEAAVAPAAIGLVGRDGVEAIVRAHLDFALRRTNLYLAAIHPPGDDAALQAAVAAVNRPLEIVLAGAGLTAIEQVHWTRLFLSAVSGYVRLRRGGQLTVPVDPDETAERLVTMVVDEIPFGDA